MRSLRIYLNGHPTVHVEARGVHKRGILVRAASGYKPFEINVDEADPIGRKRAQGKAISMIRRMRVLRRKLDAIDRGSWIHDIPNVRRLMAGLKPRHAGSKQWRIREVISAEAAPVEATKNEINEAKI